MTCSVTHCGKPTSHRTWCEGHYRRWLDHGDPTAGRRSPVGGQCSIEGCERRSKARTWCKLHYYRWKRTGLLEVASPVPVACAVEDCDRPQKSRGWCRLHYERWCSSGDPLVARPSSRDLPGPLSPNWQGEAVTYQGAHSRIRSIRGSARDMQCVDCDGWASGWSYDHADPDEIVEPADAGGKHYSAKPEHYQPRCSSCHTIFDNQVRRLVAR
jgi:hypothetical protein